jgi:hypothetical protein
MNEGGKDGPLKVTLTVNNNFAQQSDSKRQWNHYLAQMCQNHQVYFDPEVRDRVRKRVNAVLEDYKDDAKNPDMDKKLGEAIRAVFDKEVKATVKDLPHSAMRSFIGAALPNNNNSKFNFDLRNHRMGIDNSNYKDFLEFYVGENLLSLGFVFPTVDEVQLSPPRPQDKIKDPQAYDQKLKSYVITLSAMAKMKELMFGEKHSDQFREMFRKLAKPGKEEDAMKEFDKQRKIYQDSVKENIAKNPKNEKYEALIAKAGIWAKHCVTSSAAGVKPNCPPPVAGTAKLENSAQNAEQVLAKVKEPQYPKNPLTDGGTCLNPMSQTPEEMATQTELIKTVRSNVVRSRDESIQLNLDEDELAKMQKIFESGYALRNSRCVVQ